MRKLDRAFVRGVARGASLQLQTVAEGIETPEQRNHLGALGCRLGQGSLFARPMDAASLHVHLSARRRTDA